MCKQAALLKADGTQISNREVKRGLRISIVAGMVSWVWLTVSCGMPLTMFYEALGVSGVVIGIVSTIRQLSFLAQIPSAFVAERLRTRKAYWMSFAIAHRLLWIVPVFIALFMSHSEFAAWVMAGVVSLSAVLGHAAGPNWNSWMADLVPEKGRGRFWGKRQSFGTFAMMISVVAAGYILDLYSRTDDENPDFTGFVTVFAVAAVFGIVDILMYFWVPEPVHRVRRREGSAFARVTAPLKNPAFRWLIISMGIWMFCVGISGPFSSIYLRRELKVEYSYLAVLGIFSSVGAAISGFISGYILDRIGARTFGAIMMVLAGFCGAGWFFISPGLTDINLPLWGAVFVPNAVILLSAVSLLSGGLFAGVGLAQMSLIASHSPKEGRTVAMAVFWTVSGLMGAVGPVLGGIIMDWVGTPESAWMLPGGVRFGYIHAVIGMHMFIAIFIAPFLLMRVRPEEKELSVSQALGRIITFNPARAISNIYNIYTVGAAVSRMRRAKAVHTLGEKKTAIAISDLIEKLDDPASDVREEAAYALGEIDSEDALEALIDKLDDPHSDLAPQIARALRNHKSPKSVDALVEKLSEPDSEIQRETARTLGEIGDRRAVNPLLSLLRGADNEKVVLASSDALAQLGELAAIYEILPRLRRTRNPVLRRSLAVSIGDLLGERDGLYKILTTEQETYGEGAVKLLNKLRKTIRSATAKELVVHGQALVAKTGDLEMAYEDRNAERCVKLMFDLAIGMAALKHGIRYGGDDKVFVDELLWRDRHFGIGAWFLTRLRYGSWEGEADDGEMMEVLLGIYFLSCLEISAEEVAGGK